MTIDDEIENALKEGSLVMGRKNVMGCLKSGELKSVILSANCASALAEIMGHYGKNLGIDVKEFPGDSRRLGEVCGKPFNVMVLGIRDRR